MLRADVGSCRILLVRLSAYFTSATKMFLRLSRRSHEFATSKLFTVALSPLLFVAWRDALFCPLVFSSFFCTSSVSPNGSVCLENGSVFERNKTLHGVVTERRRTTTTRALFKLFHKVCTISAEDHIHTSTCVYISLGLAGCESVSKAGAAPH